MREHVTWDRLRKYAGLTMTSTALREAFGYAPTTALCDTKLSHYLERIDVNRYYVMGDRAYSVVEEAKSVVKGCRQARWA